LAQLDILHLDNENLNSKVDILNRESLKLKQELVTIKQDSTRNQQSNLQKERIIELEERLLQYQLEVNGLKVRMENDEQKLLHRDNEMDALLSKHVRIFSC
jgi:dynactin complex subunit